MTGAYSNVPMRSRGYLPLLVGIFFGLLGGWLLVDQIHGISGGPAASRPVTPRNDLLPDEKSTISTFEQASPSVVHVTSRGVRRQRYLFDVLEIPQLGTGSGFIWDDRGHIVTNFHVVASANAGIKVALADQSEWDAKVIGDERDKDIAVLEISAPSKRLRPIAVGDSRNLQVGQKVLAIGNPFGLDQTLTTGVVSALGRSFKSLTGQTIQGVIQTDAAINPGNSGGPLLDSAGRLIGMNTMIYSPSGASAGIGFAVPVEIINDVVPQLVEHGHVLRPLLGIALVDDAVKNRLELPPGVLIRQVPEGGGAEKAGLRGTRQSDEGDLILGDLITKIDDTPISGQGDLRGALDKYKPGNQVKVTYWRSGRERTTTVTLQESK